MCHRVLHRDSEHTRVNDMVNHQTDLNIQNAAVYQYRHGYLDTKLRFYKTKPHTHTHHIITTATVRTRSITTRLDPAFRVICFKAGSIYAAMIRSRKEIEAMDFL